MTAHQKTAALQIAHDLDQNDTQQVLHGGGIAWVASCTCGQYTCKPQSSPEDARRELYRHVRKMFRQIEKIQQAAHEAKSVAGHTLRSGLQAIVDSPGPVTKGRLIALLSDHPE